MGTLWVSRQVNDMMKAVLWEEKSRGGSQDPSFCSSYHYPQHYPAVDSLSLKPPLKGFVMGRDIMTCELGKHNMAEAHRRSWNNFQQGL